MLLSSKPSHREKYLATQPFREHRGEAKAEPGNNQKNGNGNAGDVGPEAVHVLAHYFGIVHKQQQKRQRRRHGQDRDHVDS